MPAALVFAVVLIVPGAVFAQSSQPPPSACRGGRVATELTLWRCCWPGQVWNDEHARCSGPPICPSYLDAQGEDCVESGTRESGESAEARISRAIEEDQHRAWRPGRMRYEGGPVPPGYRLVQGGGGLRGAGALLLVIGVTPALITGFYGLGTGRANAPLAYSFIPVAGMPISVFECGSSLCNMSPAGFLAYAVGAWAASAFQLTGAILTIVGANARPILVRDARAEQARLRITPWIAGASVGVVVTM